MNPLPQTTQAWVTEAEYLAYCEAYPEEKFELIDGEIVAMAGASFNHNLITSNLTALIHPHLGDSNCFVFASDWKVKVEYNFYYPDIVVDCDPHNHQPRLIVEVLSESTKNVDLSIKLEDYQKIPSLQEYVVVEQNTKIILVFRRKDQWKGQIYRNGNIYFESIDLTLSIEDIYRRVVLKTRNLKLVSK